MKKALIIVDVQNDFCQGGALQVPEANSIIPYINELQNKGIYDEIVLTQDFHPANHKSFASNNNRKIGEVINLHGLPQIMWPDHCIQGSLGVKFHIALKTDKVTRIIQKGKNPEVDSYSGFFDNNHLISTGLSEYLKSKDITAVDIVGLALDYCVKFTALDAIKEGFDTALLYTGTKAVNLKPSDYKDAVLEMVEAGVTIKK
ncbi:bifunctional nicotinamidase/pyrazinamidase [Zhouia sp. PK063]|uniref:bifunctional nicotinamidase/pyrazinamidase n=1 Tax=Zhouia sp. PK063 TaxID=3373602 RepID=UPI0037B74AB8